MIQRLVRLTARPEFLTPAEAAARLGTSRSTIARRIKSGEIAAVKTGTHYRIPMREFERFRDATLSAMISDVSTAAQSF